MDFRSRSLRRSVNLSAILLRSLKAERCDFLAKNRPSVGAVQKLAPTLVLLLRGTVNSELEIFKIAQNTIYEVKERQYCAGKVRQRLFSICPCTYLSTYRYTEETNGESNTFIIKLQTVTQTNFVDTLWLRLEWIRYNPVGHLMTNTQRFFRLAR